MKHGEVEKHPPSTLWTTTNKNRAVECVVRLLPSGVDVEILVNNAPLIGRRFATSEEALEFSAEQQRKWAGERATLIR